MKLDLDNCQLIGEGSYAKIYKFFSKQHKTYLCARTVTLTPQHLPELQKEKQINRELMKLTNPYILKIFGIDQQPSSILYLTQYCQGGSLFHCLDSLPNHILDLHPTISISLRIARGIQVLHKNKITHRDLKPQNILLVRKYKPGFQIPQIKIADFGLSTNNIIMQTIAGTKQYLAPQQAKFHGYTNAVDVWALGIMVDQMLHGDPYFKGENNEEVFRKVTGEEYVVRDKGLPGEVQELMMGMLKKKAFERMTIGEVIHKLEGMEQMLKTAKMGGVTLKSVREKGSGNNSEWRCKEHNEKVEYWKDVVGYCEQCVEEEVFSVEDYLKTLPPEKDLLFKQIQIKQDFDLKWPADLDLDINVLEQIKSKFQEKKMLFEGINTSNFNEVSGKQMRQNRKLREDAEKELEGVYESMVGKIKEKFYEKVDLQLDHLFKQLLQ